MQPIPDAFDPYDQWLGISPSEQPPDHYRLLGIPRFEADRGRIAAAADARMALVRTYQVGPRGRYTQRLLNEISAAKVCLTSPTAKATYDEVLRSRDQRLGATAGLPTPPVPPPLAPPLAPPVPPPPATARRITIQIDPGETAEPESDGELGEPSPWWRPMVGLVGVTLAVLAAVTLWAINTGLNRQSTSAVVRQGELPIDPPATPPAKPPEQEIPVIVHQQEASGEIHLALTTAELAGGVELIETDAGPALQNWSAEGALTQWQIALVEPGFFQIELSYATTAGNEESSLLATIGEQEKRCRLRDTGGLDTFLTDTFTIALPKSGQHLLVLRPALPAGGEIVVRSVRLIPVGGSAPAAR